MANRGRHGIDTPKAMAGPAPLPLAIALALCASPVLGQSLPGKPAMEQVIVSAHADGRPAATGDAAQLLRGKGVALQSAGGVSALPVIRGLNDDRIKVLVDGATTTSACANHMNPALSYLDASRVGAVEVMAGITPVSLGGDSIGGTIALDSPAPLYAGAGDGLRQSGALAALSRSNGHGSGIAANAGLAGERWSLAYDGARDESESYRDGNGDKVLDTLYRAENHALTLGLRGDAEELVVKFSHQDIPYQGFANQYMDMVGNRSDARSMHCRRDLASGELDIRLFWQGVDHEMGFFSDEKTGVMPMLTEGEDLGYHLAATLPLAEDLTLRLGHEYHGFSLDDRWPAVPGSAMMGPGDYININDGERDRLALYGEAEYRPGSRWTTLAGLRYERVHSDTGDVAPYNSGAAAMGMNTGMNTGMAMANPDAEAARAFNARDREQIDHNLDLTLLARFEPDANRRHEFGFARKTRSPNLYERYSWGRGTMAMTMVGWFGDGNAYLGDIDLKPEVAHTLGASLTWQGAGPRPWQLTLSPYATYVTDYIDVNPIGTFNPRNVATLTRPKLQFANRDARFYGLELFVDRELWNNGRWGRGLFKGFAGHTRGERAGGGDLYHIQPLNLRIAVEQTLGAWTHNLELHWTDAKTRVDALRAEPRTASHTLLNAGTAYQWRRVQLTLAVTNLLNEQYDLPLGGVSIAAWRAEGTSGPFEPLPGRGRSLDLGVRYRF